MIERFNYKEIATSKRMNEIVDAINNMVAGDSSSAYYAVCNDSAATVNKNIVIDNFSGGTVPFDGTMIVVKMVNGNVAENITLTINDYTNLKPIYHGGMPVFPDTIKAGDTITLVYDATDERYYITAGVDTPLPALYIKSYNLQSIINGRYTEQSVLADLYNTIVGTGSKKVFDGYQMLMLYNKSYIPICLVEEEAAYTFEFIYASKHYQFIIYKKGSGETVLDITDNGSSIITQWEE